MIRKTKRKYGCPVEFSIDQLSGKWKTVIPVSYTHLTLPTSDLV